MKENTKNPEIFISHSWSTSEHEDWIMKLVNRLHSDGVVVRMDFSDLKPGQDVIYFMEKMLKNENIKKVLVICDKYYQQKANAREKGVGIETQLIAKQVYEDPEQEKIIPIIKERDKNGDAYLPDFMKSRFYLDLSDDDVYEKGYRELIKNIRAIPMSQESQLGPVPQHIISKTKSAQTFNDVPTDAWYFDYVEQLVDDGVIDSGDNFYPDNTLTHAEFIKIVITAIDGLAGYEAPRTPTFYDVPIDAWYFDYVESAVQLGIISGYTDADGNLTGLFGPEDITNRAWATKLLVNSFSISRTIPASPFTDVTPSHPYYGYILMCYSQSIIDGFDDNTFHPDEALTRALMAKWIINAQNPVQRDS